MNSLVIVVALVTITCADAAHLGNNYVVPAINNNDLQDTYILPATKSQSTYVALPVSILNTHVSSNPGEVSQNNVISSTLQIKSAEVQLPKSISTVLAKNTQKTIQGTVQKIIQKTVSTSIPSKSSLLSTNTYLPPKTKTSASHKHLPEFIDKPPKAIQEIVKKNSNNPPATVKVSQYIDNSSALKSKSTEVHLPEVINTFTSKKTIEKTVQKTVNIAAKPVQVSQSTVLYSSPNAKTTKLNFSDIVHNYDSIPTKANKNTVNTSVQPFKVSQITGISSTLKAKSSEVHLSESSIISTPLKTETVKLSQNTGISSSSPKVIQETVNTPTTPVQVSQRIATSSPLKTKSSEVKTKNTPFPSASLQIPQNTDSASTLKKKSPEVKIVNTSNTPALVKSSQNPDISLTLKTKSTVVKTVNNPILTTSVQVSKNTNTASTLKTTSSEIRIPEAINSSVPKQKTIEKIVNTLPQPVQVRQRIDSFSAVKAKSSEVRLPVKINTTLPTKSSISALSKTVQKSQASSHPAALSSPPSLWHLPKLIDIVQKTIKTSVNSNIKPKEVVDPVIIKILPGSAHGAENSYLPPDLKKKH